MQNLIYESVIFHNFPKFWALNLRKFFKKSGNFGQTVVQYQAYWYMNGSLFLEKYVYVQGLQWFPAARPYYYSPAPICLFFSSF